MTDSSVSSVLGDLRQKIQNSGSSDARRAAVLDATEFLSHILQRDAGDYRSLSEKINAHPALARNERLKRAIKTRNKLVAHREPRNIQWDPMGRYAISRSDALEVINAIEDAMTQIPSRDISSDLIQQFLESIFGIPGSSGSSRNPTGKASDKELMKTLGKAAKVTIGLSVAAGILSALTEDSDKPRAKVTAPSVKKRTAPSVQKRTSPPVQKRASKSDYYNPNDVGIGTILMFAVVIGFSILGISVFLF